MRSIPFQLKNVRLTTIFLHVGQANKNNIQHWNNFVGSTIFEFIGKTTGILDELIQK